MAFLGGIVNKIGDALGLGASKGSSNGGGGQSGGSPSRAAPGGSKGGLPGFNGGGGLPGEGSSTPHGPPAGFPGKPSNPAPAKPPSPAPAPAPAPAPKPPSIPKPSPQPKPSPSSQPKPQPQPQPKPQPQPQPQPKPLPLPNPDPQPPSNSQAPGDGSAGGGNGGSASPGQGQGSPPDPDPSAPPDSSPPQNLSPTSPATGQSSPAEDNDSITPVSTIPNGSVPAGDPINSPSGISSGVGSTDLGPSEPTSTPATVSPASSSGPNSSGLSPAVSAIIAVVVAFIFVLLLLCIFRRWMVYRRKLRRQRVQTLAWPAVPSPRDNSTDSGWDFSSNGGASVRSSTGFTAPPMTALPSAVLATAVANMPGNTPRAQIFDLGRLQIPPSPPHDGSAHTGSSSGRLAPAQSLDIEAEADSYRTGTPTPVRAAFHSAWNAFPDQPQPMTLHHQGASVSSFASASSQSSLGTVIHHVEFPHPPSPSYQPFTAARPLTIETRSVNVPNPMSSPLFQVDDPFAHPMDAMSMSGHGHDARSIVSGHAH